MKIKWIVTTLIAIAVALLIIIFVPRIINHTNNITESTQEKVIRWYIENKKEPYKEYESYEDYVRMKSHKSN